MTGTRRAQQARAVEKKKLILEAATSQLFEEGVRCVTHRQVATRAGVAVGSIGYYYSTREELLVTALEEVSLQRAEAAKTALSDIDGNMPTPEVVDLLLRVVLGGEPSNRLLVGWMGILVDCLRESMALREQLQKLRREAYADVRTVLDAAGDKNADESHILATISGTVLASLAEGRDNILDSVQEALTAVLYRDDLAVD